VAEFLHDSPESKVALREKVYGNVNFVKIQIALHRESAGQSLGAKRQNQLNI
jgi:hypothetical protein